MEEALKQWCTARGHQFIGITKDGERFKFVERDKAESPGYMFTLLDCEQVEGET